MRAKIPVGIDIMFLEFKILLRRFAKGALNFKVPRIIQLNFVTFFW